MSQRQHSTAGIPAVAAVADRYCLSDLHQASGSEKRHQPSNWLMLAKTKELVTELEENPAPVAGNPATGLAVVTLQGGTIQGTYAIKELVYAYAMWISAKFHLHVIRAYDAMITERVDSVPQNRGTVFNRRLSAHGNGAYSHHRIRGDVAPRSAPAPAGKWVGSRWESGDQIAKFRYLGDRDTGIPATRRRSSWPPLGLPNLPNLCPTIAQPLGPHGCAVYPTYPTFSALARIRNINRRRSVSLYVCVNRLGRLGRLGKVSHGAVSRCPTSPVKGWAGRAELGRRVRLARGRGSSLALPYAGRAAAKPLKFQTLGFGLLPASEFNN